MGSISLEELAGKRREKEEQGNGELVVTGQGQVKKQEEMSAALTPEERKKVDAIKESLDLTDSQACIQYGTGAQRNISDFSEGQRLCGRAPKPDIVKCKGSGGG